MTILKQEWLDAACAKWGHRPRTRFRHGYRKPDMERGADWRRIVAVEFTERITSCRRCRR